MLRCPNHTVYYELQASGGELLKLAAEHICRWCGQGTRKLGKKSYFALFNSSRTNADNFLQALINAV